MKTLVVYLMSGSQTPELAAAAVEGGADIVELGFPFSDPLADGPVIRRAAERALAEGMRTRACLECLERTHELGGYIGVDGTEGAGDPRTRRRARLASCFAAAGDRPTMAPISSNGMAKRPASRSMCRERARSTSG